jgi:hypothetical protein
MLEQALFAQNPLHPRARGFKQAPEETLNASVLGVASGSNGPVSSSQYLFEA